MSVELTEYLYAVKNWNEVVLHGMNRRELAHVVKLRQWCIDRTRSVYGQWIDAPGRVSPDFHIDDQGYTEWGKDWRFYFKELEVAIEFKFVYQTIIDDAINKT